MRSPHHPRIVHHPDGPWVVECRQCRDDRSSSVPIGIGLPLADQTDRRTARRESRRTCRDGCRRPLTGFHPTIRPLRVSRPVDLRHRVCRSDSESAHAAPTAAPVVDLTDGEWLCGVVTAMPGGGASFGSPERNRNADAGSDTPPSDASSEQTTRDDHRSFAAGRGRRDRRTTSESRTRQLQCRTVAATGRR